MVADRTLYSDAYYHAENLGKADVSKGTSHVSMNCHLCSNGANFCCVIQIDLPTLLEDRSLSIDIFRYGPIVSIKINGFSTVIIADGIARDGVIHAPSSVLIPPKPVGGILQEWQGEELTVEELKERLEPFVDREDL